jgi:Fe2+ or Zn2+ uptake regulation protein
MENLEKKAEEALRKAEEAMSRLRPVIFERPVLEEPEEEPTLEDLYNESLFERFDDWRKD